MRGLTAAPESFLLSILIEQSRKTLIKFDRPVTGERHQSTDQMNLDSLSDKT